MWNQTVDRALISGVPEEQILEVKQHRIEKAVVRLEEHAETQEKERV